MRRTTRVRRDVVAGAGFEPTVSAAASVGPGRGPPGRRPLRVMSRSLRSEEAAGPSLPRNEKSQALHKGVPEILWSVRPIKMFAKTLYLQGFAGQRRLFFLFFGWDLADFLPKGDFSVRPKKISAYSYFFSF